MFAFLNSICFATCLDQMSCKGGKTDGETRKLNRKCFFKKVEGNKWRNTKNQIKNFKFLVCFSHIAQT